MSEKKNAFRFRFPEFLLIGLLLVSNIVLNFSSGGFILDVKKIGFSVFSTVEKGVHFVVKGVSDSFNAVAELKKLKKEYNTLVIMLENYEKMQRTNADIRKENERLREQLNFSISMDEKNYPAQIIARDLDDVYAYLTIDKGSVNGIKKNMPVVAFQNGNTGLVGKVVRVGSFTSQIMPVYNLNYMVSARVQNLRDLGLVNGNGNQDKPLVFQHIRKKVKDELSIGDIIVTSGENDNYLKDIPIGTISKIESPVYDSSLDIELIPIIDFARLENVIVVNQKQLNDRKGEN